MKKLLFITGTRADFGKLEPLASCARLAGFKIYFFVTGMHLLEKYGLTSIEVSRMKKIKRFEFINQMEGDPQDKILSKTITGISEYVSKLKPDLVLIHGDRIEAVAASLVCATNNIRSAHIEGGEVSGTIDEVYRHCNTKLCTVHFVSSKSAKNRVTKLGEHPDRVFVLGSPELDAHKKRNTIPLHEVLSYYDIQWDKYGIFIFHSVTSELESLKQEIQICCDSLKELKKNFVVISPNNDPGCEIIFKAIGKLPSSHFKQIPSMRFSYFSTLLKNSQIIIGNSSVGVREAPFLGVPSINIGSRQFRRAEAKSIKNVDVFKNKNLDKLVESLWGKRFPTDNSFGTGQSAKKFTKILKDKKIWKLNLQKAFFETSTT